MTKRITIIEVKDYVGQEVTIGAWVANKSGKGKIAFLQLRDGTAFFQGVAFKPNFIVLNLVTSSILQTSK